VRLWPVRIRGNNGSHREQAGSRASRRRVIVRSADLPFELTPVGTVWVAPNIECRYVLVLSAQGKRGSLNLVILATALSLPGVDCLWGSWVVAEPGT